MIEGDNEAINFLNSRKICLLHLRLYFWRLFCVIKDVCCTVFEAFMSSLILVGFFEVQNFNVFFKFEFYNATIKIFKNSNKF